MVEKGRAQPVKLRPQSHFFTQAFFAVVAFMVPVFIVLYTLTIPHGPWRAVLVLQVIVTLAVVAGTVSYFRAAIWVDSAGLTEVGFFGRRRRVVIDEIGSVFFAEVFDQSGERTLPQLFVCDRAGKQLVRMRGQFWSRENMDLVLATLDVPAIAHDDSVSTSELRDEYPGLLYWFERRPVVGALAFAGGVAAVGAIVYFLFTLPA